MRRFLFSILMIITIATAGQTKNTCDTVYDFVEVIPSYSKGDFSILDELTPILSKYYDSNGDIGAISKLYATLTINKNGKVVDVILLNSSLPEACKKELIDKFKKMQGWSPGRMNAKPVCCRYHLAYSCIKWE